MTMSAQIIDAIFATAASDDVAAPMAKELRGVYDSGEWSPQAVTEAMLQSDEEAT